MGCRTVLIALAAALSTVWAQPAWSACKITLIAELPVTMDGDRAMVPVKINGVDTKLVVDSGSFFNMVSPASAAEFHMVLDPAPDGFVVEGLNGRTEDVKIGKAANFTVAGITYHNVRFVVAGTGLGGDGAGLLGQNVLDVADVEYDLPDGIIRLFRESDCHGANLAYWAGSQGHSELALDEPTNGDTDTAGWATLNGVRIHVQFDTGTGDSMLSLRAAQRAGVKPGDPGVVAAGYTSGITAHSYLRAWIAPFSSFELGDEGIKNFKLEIGAMGTDVDMLVGMDFFHSHRVFVSNDQNRMFFTYTGGPVFRTEHPPTAPVAAAPTGAGGSADASSLTADGYARRAAAEVSRRDQRGAVADLDSAIALAPNEPAYRVRRAEAEDALDKGDAALADLDAALKLDPRDIDALIDRADMRLDQSMADEARIDLKAAEAALKPDDDQRHDVAMAELRADMEPAALHQLDLWITGHPNDDRLAGAVNARCWTKALRNEDLDGALADCNHALMLEPGAPDILGSRGLVRLRRGEYEKAIVDYNGSLKLQPNHAWSLYGRGLAELKLGRSAEGQADLAAARRADKDMDAIAEKRGLKP